MKKLLIVSLVIFLLASAFLSGAEAIAGTYSTNFPLTEDSISEGGNWINGKTVGLDWKNVATIPGLAYGTGGSSYDDPTAILTGTWSPNQSATAKVHSINQNGSIYQEVELRLRSAISAHRNTGYEINFRCLKTGAAYSEIVRWNGPLGNFTYLSQKTGSQYGVTEGDVVRATIIGNVINVYLNDVLINTATDNTYATGNPGIGYYGPRSTEFGFISFTATDLSSSYYSVTASAGANGSLSCVSPVIHGSTTTCIASPNGGYNISRFSGCGGTWVSGNLHHWVNYERLHGIGNLCDNYYSISPDESSHFASIN